MFDNDPADNAHLTPGDVKVKANLVLGFARLRGSSPRQPAPFTPPLPQAANQNHRRPNLAKIFVVHSVLFALIGLILAPLGVAHAQSASDDSSKKPIATFSLPDLKFPRHISSVAFSSDGRLLALEASYSSTPAPGTLWDVVTGESIATVPLQDRVDATAFSPDGKLIALGFDNGKTELWDVSSGETVATIVHNEERFGGVSYLSFAPNGRLLAAGEADFSVGLWGVPSGRRVGTVPVIEAKYLRDGVVIFYSIGTVTAIAFSSDSRLLATDFGEGGVHLWDVVNRKTVFTIDAHDRDDWDSLSFSPDGKLLASGGSRFSEPPFDSDTSTENTEIKLWDVATGEFIAILSGSAPVSFSPNGRLLASASALERKWVYQDNPGGGGSGSSTASGDKAIELWDASTGESIATLLIPRLVYDNRWLSLDKVLFSPDSRLLAVVSRDQASIPNTVHLWDVSEWEPMPHALTSASGDGQQGQLDAALAEPFVVSVSDQYGFPLAGAVVSFAVTAGGGTLSATTATTDANGHARSTLTLGGGPGPNAVKATVAGLEPVTFTAAAIDRTPRSLTKISGDGQQGPASTPLAVPFVVEVLGRDGSPLAEETVTFAVTAGGGILAATPPASPCTIEFSRSSATVTTDANGRAATRLTLGGEPGPNAVEATVAGLEPVTFTAAAADPARPHRLTKICGASQEGTAGQILANPFVVAVSDEHGTAIAGAVVHFAITAGEGDLSATTATTNANGRAATRLTLGRAVGSNTVEATVAGLEPVTFTAVGQESPLVNLFGSFLGRGKRTALPTNPQLAQNAPNPFNSQTVLAYFLPAPSSVRLEVFALTGQRVAVLYQGPQQAGYHRLPWDARDDAGRPVASGTYLYRLVTDEVVLTRKLTLLR